MSKKEKKKINLQVDDDIYEMCKNLRSKYYINISSLCRNAIEETYIRLKNASKIN